MFDVKTTAAELDSMLHDIIVRNGVFVSVGKKTYQFKNYLVTKAPEAGWLIFQVKERKIFIASTFLKVSAFAICKYHDRKSQRCIDDIIKNDQIFQKNYIDSLFYKKTISSAESTVTKDTALWRYEIAHAAAKESKEIIDRLFYLSLA